VNHHAKAASAGSTQATGASRGLFRRALATRGASGGSKGSGAPAAKLLGLLAISLIALFASAAPASAAPPTVGTPVVSDVSYTSAHVIVEVTSDGSEGFSEYQFQYSSDDGATWSPGEGGFLQASPSPQTLPSDLHGLKGGTHYKVRLSVNTHCLFGCAGPLYYSPEAEFTTLPVDPPTISAVDASEVISIAAKATGKVKRPANESAAFDVNCRFEYVTDQLFVENEANSLPGFAGATPAPCEQNPVTEASADENGEQAVSAQLTGLQPETTYHLRLVAENASPTATIQVAVSTFTTPTVAKPTVTAIDDASEVKYNSAKFTGKVLRPAGDDPGLDVNCRFEYVTQAQFEAEEFDAAAPNNQIAGCAQNPITADKVDAGGEMEVSAKAGLLPETTYHLRLVAENVGGSDAEVAASTFTTPEAELPTVTIDPVEGGVFTVAHVTGTVTLADGHGSGSVGILQVSSDGGATWSSSEMLWSPTFGPYKGKFAPYYIGAGGQGEVGPGTQGEGLYVVKADLAGLQPSTTYLFRIAASYNSSFLTNGEGEGIELPESRGEVAHNPLPNPSITTEPAQSPPTAEDLAVTNVTGTSAHFSGTVNPHAPAGPLSEGAKKAFATQWHFECTPECKDVNGNAIAGGTVQGEEGAQTVTGDARRLDPNTSYEVSLVISNEGGGETVVETFDTLKIPPTVKAVPGGSDGKGGYTLQGIVNPNNETITGCEFKWGPNAPAYAFSAPCSPTDIGGAKPITVEAHLTGLNPGVTYHALLVVTYGAGAKVDGGDQEFVVTLADKENCTNAQVRAENNSLALPECRAYEMVTASGKEGFSATLEGFDGGARVHYLSGAGNIAKSGQNSLLNHYVTERTATGWETIPNLNGSSGTFKDAPSYTERGPRDLTYSKDLLSSIWYLHRKGDVPGRNPYLRNPDGTFTLIGIAEAEEGSRTKEGRIVGASDDLSHLFIGPDPFTAGPWGPGVYEFVGTGNDQPRRVDVDNSGSPISNCFFVEFSGLPQGNAYVPAGGISRDGRVAVIQAIGGCGGDNPPVQEVWARVDGTTSIDVSASHCTRTAADPGGACNAPAKSAFLASTPDGSRIFFTTTQQLVNGDTDQTNDIYACDIPQNTPAPTGEANSCAALIEVSGAASEADIALPNFSIRGVLENNLGALSTSDDGSTVVFVSPGVLADNDDALGEEAVAGDHNLYVWRQNAADPVGQTTFVGRLNSQDILVPGGEVPDSTPDGRYLAFTTANQLLDTDTDAARDVYRYDADTGELIRASTNAFGVAGNGDFDAATTNSAISDDGQKIVFGTAEALSPIDGNGEGDVYLWTPDRGSLISTGSVGGGGSGAAIAASGGDIYFSTGAALTPADGDDQGDVYDARVGGGFSFASKPICVGEGCQPGASAQPVSKPLASRGASSGNPTPVKPCPKGKVRKKNGKCVKKPHKKHSGKKHHGKKASHKRGGGK
jgi:hypothetical protein